MLIQHSILRNWFNSATNCREKRRTRSDSGDEVKKKKSKIQLNLSSSKKIIYEDKGASCGIGLPITRHFQPSTYTNLATYVFFANRPGSDRGVAGAHAQVDGEAVADVGRRKEEDSVQRRKIQAHYNATVF